MGGRIKKSFVNVIRFFRPVSLLNHKEEKIFSKNPNSYIESSQNVIFAYKLQETLNYKFNNIVLLGNINKNLISKGILHYILENVFTREQLGVLHYYSFL